jgi:hypothetical protein
MSDQTTRVFQIDDRRITFYVEAGGMKQERHVKGQGWVLANDEEWHDLAAIGKTIKGLDEIAELFEKAFGEEKLLQFKCAKCNGTQIECVQSDVLMTSPVRVVGDEVIYGEAEISSAEIDRFQCEVCGHVLKGITDDEELIEFLKENQPK